MIIRYCSAGALLALALTAPLAARAQAAPVPWGSWFIFLAQLPGNANARWGGYAEAQVRTNAVLRQYFYHEYKAGLSYDVDPNVSVLLGAGRYVTSDYRRLEAGPVVQEFRVWQQAVLSQYARRLKLEHRYRVEQRWQSWQPDSAAFRWRLRYRLNLILPLNTRKVEPGTVFLAAYDEIFLNPHGPRFERNRFYAGLGYQLSAPVVVQAGWLRQADFQPGGEGSVGVLGKNNLVLSLGYRWLRRAAGTEQNLPSLGE